MHAALVQHPSPSPSSPPLVCLGGRHEGLEVGAGLWEGGVVGPSTSRSSVPGPHVARVLHSATLHKSEKEKMFLQELIVIPMFTAALFTVTRTWKQPKCPSTDEWIKKM